MTNTITTPRSRTGAFSPTPAGAAQEGPRLKTIEYGSIEAERHRLHAHRPHRRAFIPKGSLRWIGGWPFPLIQLLPDMGLRYDPSVKKYLLGWGLCPGEPAFLHPCLSPDEPFAENLTNWNTSSHCS
jgi:hypothetical protein